MADEVEYAPGRGAVAVSLGRGRRLRHRQLARLVGALDVRRVLRRSPGRVCLEARRGGARLLLELVVAPRLLAPGWLAVRPLGRPTPGAGWRATHRPSPCADRWSNDAVAVLPRLRRPRRCGHRLRP